MVPNKTLAGRYRLTDRLGRAEFVDVYSARDLVLQRDVVVKVLPANEDSEASARFVAGAKALSQLDHPGIVRVFDADVEADEPYLVTERVPGRPLCDLLAEGRLDPERAAHVGAQVAAALMHAHEHGVVHSDVRPSNVYVEADGTARLADFGMAGVPDLARVTVTGQLLGSEPAYVAPEQVRGDEVGPPADVYALGLLLLEAVTGRPPFPGTPIESALARLEREVVLPDDLPEGWHAALRAMTRRDPRSRPTAAAVHGWLQDPGSVALHAPRDTTPESETTRLSVAARRRHSATRRAPRRRRSLPRWHRSATSITSLATAAALVAVALTGSNLEAIVRPLRDAISPPAAASAPEADGEDAEPVAFGPVTDDAVGGPRRSSQLGAAVRQESGVPREDRLPSDAEARRPGDRGADAAASSSRAPTRGQSERGAPRGDDLPPAAGTPDPATPGAPGQGGTPPGQGGKPPGQGGTPPGQGGTPPGQNPGGGSREPDRAAPDRAAPDREPPEREAPPSTPPATAPPPRQEPSREPPQHVPTQTPPQELTAPSRQEPDRGASAAKAGAPAALAPQAAGGPGGPPGE